MLEFNGLTVVIVNISPNALIWLPKAGEEAGTGPCLALASGSRTCYAAAPPPGQKGAKLLQERITA